MSETLFSLVIQSFGFDSLSTEIVQSLINLGLGGRTSNNRFGIMSADTITNIQEISTLLDSFKSFDGLHIDYLANYFLWNNVGNKLFWFWCDYYYYFSSSLMSWTSSLHS
jgi:hypothetical protein